MSNNRIIPDTKTVQLFGKNIPYSELCPSIVNLLGMIESDTAIGNILSDTKEVFMIVAIDCQRKKEVLSTHLVTLSAIPVLLNSVSYPETKDDQNAFTIIIDIPSKFYKHIHLFNKSLNIPKCFDDVKKKLSVVNVPTGRKYPAIVDAKREFNLAKFVLQNSVANMTNEAAIDQLITVLAGRHSGLIK